MSSVRYCLKSACDPVHLYDTKISCLLYVDDLILLSKSPNGLQFCLSKVEIYCNKWNLEVNVSKTKVMVFNKSGRILTKYNFHFRTTYVEAKICSYVYLGIKCVVNGSFSEAIIQLKEKATKANFGLFNIIYNHNISIKTACKLFDTLVLPVLRYGSEIWLPYVLNDFNCNNFLKICDTKRFRLQNLLILNFVNYY